MILNHLHLKKSKKPMECRNTTVWIWHANIAYIYIYISYIAFKMFRKIPAQSLRALHSSTSDVLKQYNFPRQLRSDFRFPGVLRKHPKNV